MYTCIFFLAPNFYATCFKGCFNHRRSTAVLYTVYIYIQTYLLLFYVLESMIRASESGGSG